PQINAPGYCIGAARAYNNRNEPPPGQGDRHRGVIIYGYAYGASPSSSNQALNYSWVHLKNYPGYGEVTYVDLYVDGRTQAVPPIASACATTGTLCLQRITAIKDPNVYANRNLYTYPNNDSLYSAGYATNFSECTTPGACPNFYTGVG